MRDVPYVPDKALVDGRYLDIATLDCPYLARYTIAPHIVNDALTADSDLVVLVAWSVTTIRLHVLSPLSAG